MHPRGGVLTFSSVPCIFCQLADGSTGAIRFRFGKTASQMMVFVVIEAGWVPLQRLKGLEGKCSQKTFLGFDE